MRIAVFNHPFGHARALIGGSKGFRNHAGLSVEGSRDREWTVARASRAGPVAPTSREPPVTVFRTSVVRFFTRAALAVGIVAGTAAAAQANSKYAAYVMDARTGKVLHASSAHAPRYPASLTKMMTLYLMFEEMRHGRMNDQTRIRMSRYAAKRPPSKIPVRAGGSISARQAMLALVTKSANNVATAVAEHISGTEAAFARRMTLKARQLGMKRTTFRNAHGLPNRAQRTTAADMAKLGHALRQHFPRRYRIFTTRSFKFGRRNYPNHNKLLGRVRGVDGIKTGYIRASGYNLVTSAGANGRRIVAVVMGGRSGARRNRAMKRLVGKYLPRASRRGSGKLVAAWRSSAPSGKRDTVLVSAPAKLLENVTVPALKKEITTTAVERAPAMPRTKATPKSTPFKRTGSWAVQVGASGSYRGAQSLIRQAQRRARAHVSGRGTTIATVRSRRGKRLFRARFVGFSKYQARQACRQIKRRKMDCLAVKG